MKESIGYTVTLNVVIIFITIVLFFLTASIVYFKSNKVNNIIVYSIEKYEGYNTLAKNEISANLTSLGYTRVSINCGTTKDGCLLVSTDSGKDGYCVYMCDSTTNSPYYKVRTNLMLNLPIISSVVNFPIYSNTNNIYNFG